VAEGGLAATAAGDYLIGAWAIVMLHDYHRGQDFAAHGGLNQKLDYLYVVNRDNVARYDQAFFQRGDALDFERRAIRGPGATTSGCQTEPRTDRLGDWVTEENRINRHSRSTALRPL